MQISDKAVQTIKSDNKAMGALIQLFDKHYRTIENWLDNKDIRLTTPNAVATIKEVTGLKEKEILQKETEVAA